MIINQLHQWSQPGSNRRPLACKAWSGEAHLRIKSVSMWALYGSTTPVLAPIRTKSVSQLTQLLTHPRARMEPVSRKPNARA